MSSNDAILVEVLVQLSAERAVRKIADEIAYDSSIYESVITCKKDGCNGNAVQEHPLQDARDYICLRCGLNFKISPRGSKG